MCVIMLELGRTWRRKITNYCSVYREKFAYRAPAKTAYKVSTKQSMWTKHQMRKAR